CCAEARCSKVSEPRSWGSLVKRTAGYSLACSTTHSSKRLRESLVQTARVTTSCFLCSAVSSCTCGRDARHGRHHVAQKSSTTTLPAKSDRRTSLPSASRLTKSGATAPAVSGPFGCGAAALVGCCAAALVDCCAAALVPNVLRASRKIEADGRRCCKVMSWGLCVSQLRVG